MAVKDVGGGGCAVALFGAAAALSGREGSGVTLLGVPWYLYRYLPTCLLFIKVLPLLVTQVELCRVYPGYAQSYESVPMMVPQVSILPCLFFNIINHV